MCIWSARNPDTLAIIINHLKEKFNNYFSICIVKDGVL